MMQSEDLSYGLIFSGLIILGLIIFYSPITFIQWLIALSVMSLCIGIGGWGLSLNYTIKTSDERQNLRGGEQ